MNWQTWIVDFKLSIYLCGTENDCEQFAVTLFFNDLLFQCKVTVLPLVFTTLLQTDPDNNNNNNNNNRFTAIKQVNLH